MHTKTSLACAAALALGAAAAHADENLFGYVRGSETLPKGAWELYQFATVRADKGAGRYRAVDYLTEVEYGFSDRLTVSGGLHLQSIDTSGLTINGYLPGAREFGPKFAGISLEAKYSYLQPAKDDIGLSTTFEFKHLVVDPHSGRDKNTTKVEFGVQLQKLFAEGQWVWVGSGAFEGTYAKRKPIDDLPADFEWPTGPEMELEVKLGTGLSYRFAPNWYVGLETQYETEFETEVGQERWSVFGGPTLHYGGQKGWATLTYFRQLRGGGERYDGQTNTDLHLIEKTRHELRLKVGFNF